MVSPGKPQDAEVLASEQTARSFFKSLTAEEKDLYQATTFSHQLLSEVTDADAKHKEGSGLRKASTVILPFIAGIQQYATALDVFANSNDLLCPIWGGIRVVLHLGQEFGEYFDKLADMLEEIGGVLGRLPKIVHLYPDNVNLRTSMVEIYRAIFDFCTKAKDVFRVGKSRVPRIGSFRHAVGLAAALRLVWKPFTVQFGGIKDRILKHVKSIDAEADIAERDLAKQERERDDTRWSKAEKSQRQVAEFIDGEQAAKVNQWLSPANVSTNHKAASSLRHDNTGSWFLEADVFQTWLNSSNSFLWLHAIPGAGKTILASSVINYLRDNVQSKEVGLAYFYCDYKDATKQEPSKLLGTLLATLAKQNRDVYEELQSFFIKQFQESSAFTAEFDELVNYFESFIGNHFKSVIIVIDALDEAGLNYWDCLTHALKTLQQRCSRLKILVTSRDELPIRRAFEGLPWTSIEQSDVAPDIMSFITSEVDDSIAKRKLKLRDPELKGIIVESLVAGARGMFQWARCQIDSLCKLRNDKAIRAALTNLPRTLQDTYMRILQRVEDDYPDDVDTVRKILCWLVRGIKDLTLDELAEAIAIDVEGDDDSMDFSAVDNDPEDILELLGGLVTLSASKTISLAHFSVKEFLVSADMKKGKQVFWIADQSVHAQLATVCLTYLCYSNFAEPLTQDKLAFEVRLEEYKFFQYAVQAWAVHAHKSELDGRQDEKLVDLTMRLFSSRQGREENFLSWAEATHMGKYHRQLNTKTLDPIYVAAFFGLTEATEQLLEESALSNCDMTGAFRAAAARGHASVVGLFLKDAQRRAESADVTQTEVEAREAKCRDLNLDQALYSASAQGHVEVIQVLSNHGADINARGKDGTAIQAAALEGRADAVALLLEKGAAHYIPCKRFGTPLAAAAEKGHERTVSVLLAAGANSNGRGGYYASPLVSAIVGRNMSIVRMLIDKGAELNTRGGRYGCPLMAAAAMGMDALVQELVDLGAKVNDEDDKTTDALYSASLAGHSSTVDLLLSLGADVNAKGGKHRYALGAACSEGHTEVAERLIAAGADVHYFDEHYGNALQTAAQNGHVAILKALVEAGADPSEEGGDRGSALVCAAAAGQNDAITALYELGVETGPDGDVTNALVAAASAGHQSTIALLVEHGALAGCIAQESHTMSYCTPVEAAAANGHLGVVNLLLGLDDVTLHENDGWYGSPLTAAVTAGKPSIPVVTALLDHGADPNLVTTSGNGVFASPLVHAASGNNAAIVKLLLDRGADINLKEGTMKSAVQMAATHEDGEMLHLLVSRGADVNLVAEPDSDQSKLDDQGLDAMDTVTAMQIAAALGHVSNVRKLKDLGADLSIQLDNGEAPFISALQVAAFMCQAEVVNVLIELGSDVTEQGGYCGSALQAAAYAGDLEIVTALLEAGADANESDVGAWGSPLLAACCCADGNSQPRIIRLLSEHGADVNFKAKRKALPYALHMAVFHHEADICLVEILLELGADANAFGGKYGTSLQIAAQVGDVDHVLLLLSNGADPNTQGGIFNTALQAAYSHGYYRVLGALYKHCANSNAIGGMGGSVVGMALGVDSPDGELGCCPTLLFDLVTRRNLDINAQYGFYGNALQNAVIKDREDAIYYVAKAGANVNAVGGRMGTAFAAAAWMGNMEILEYLLESGADANLGGHRYPNAAFAAVRGGEAEALARLLKEKMDMKASGRFGTILQLAARHTYGDLTILRMLTRAGAEVNPPVCGEFGTPLQAAAVDGRDEVIRFLLNRGADVSARGGRFGGVMNAAARHSSYETVAMLLDRGADPNERGTTYGPPLQGAAASGALYTSLVLLQRGADVNATGGRYHTALQGACAAGDVDIVKLLMERGADVNKKGGLHGSALQAAAVSGNRDLVQYMMDHGAVWEKVDRKKAFASEILNAADELLVRVRDGVTSDWEDDETCGNDDEDDDEEGEEEQDEKEDTNMPLNVESIPGFQKPWQRASRRRWDLVREMSLHSLQEKGTVAGPQLVDDTTSNHESIGSASTIARTGSLETQGSAADGPWKPNRASIPMPIMQSEETTERDPNWDVLTMLEEGDMD